MKRHHKASLLFLLLFSLGLIWKMTTHEESKEFKMTRKVASVPSAKKAPPLFPKRLAPHRPHVLPGINKKESDFKKRIPQSVANTFEMDTDIAVTRGFIFVKDIAAISKEKFHSSLGEVIQRTEQFVFFRSKKYHNYIPVAISRTTNILYPISSILHVKGVTPDMRERLLSTGLRQYYYHRPLKLLSLQSHSSKILSLYSELKQDGHQVELEVLKPPHQII